MTSPAHIIAFAAVTWGHTKSIVILLQKLADLRPASKLTLTIFTGEPMLTKVLEELKSMSKSTADRINVMDIGALATPFEPQVGFIPLFQDIWAGKAVTKVDASGATVLPKPSVVILNPMNGFAIPVIKETSNDACPIVAWFSSTMSSLMLVAGPENLGGMGDLGARIEAEAQRTGKQPLEVADSVYYRYDGNPHHIPGVPPMYDYDFFPQDLNFPFPVAVANQYWYRNILASNGVMAVTASAFEAESITACRLWLGDLGKDAFVVGPLDNVPSATGMASSTGVETTPVFADEAPIVAFLDEMHAKHGPKSVIYLAFGTIFSPRDTSKLEAVFDEMIASGTPVLWGHASPFAVISKSLEDKFASSPNAFHATWTPQRKILSHPATGWLISHGGWNSMQEALSLHVPMIMWPFGADQPSNASIIVNKHRAAFELYSIRSGKGMRQPRCLDSQKAVDFSVGGVRQEVRELLAKMKAEEGAEVRSNAERLGVDLVKSWEKGGEANLQAEAFLRKYASV